MIIQANSKKVINSINSDIIRIVNYTMSKDGNNIILFNKKDLIIFFIK